MKDSYEAFLPHVGHKMGISVDPAYALLVCRDCDVCLAEVSKDKNPFTYNRWTDHQDAAAEVLSLRGYEGMEPNDDGYPEHWVVCVAYGDAADPENVAIECESCGLVLADHDVDEEE